MTHHSTNLQMTVADIHVLQRIVEIQTDIAGEISASRVMRKIVDQSQALTGSQGAVVEIAEGEHMVYKAVSGIAEPHLGLRLERRSSLSGRCVDTGEILSCEDSETDERVDREACRRIGLRSMLVVPLLKDGVAVGVLKVLAVEPHAFDEQDVYVLQMLAGFIASVLHNSAVYEASKARALHDQLTGLPNRTLFRERVLYEISRARRAGGRFAVLYIDLDEFKQINDTLGHECGDAVLIECGRRLLAGVREMDTVARLGGDEFAVLLVNLNPEDDPDLLAGRLDRALNDAPFETGGGPATLGASIGVACAVGGDSSYEDLLRHADEAMYRTKAARRARRQ